MQDNIRVKYNKKNLLVEGFFPCSINYKNNVIDKEAKTIDGSPYIEINEEEYQAALGKTMCVVDGNLQEYVKTDNEVLEETKATKIAQCKSYLNKTDWYIIRLADSGDVIPDEVRTKRTQARNNIDLIEACTTLDELNPINTDF